MALSMRVPPSAFGPIRGLSMASPKLIRMSTYWCVSQTEGIGLLPLWSDWALGPSSPNACQELRGLVLPVLCGSKKAAQHQGHAHMRSENLLAIMGHGRFRLAPGRGEMTNDSMP